jgi:hypothetical protein
MNDYEELLLKAWTCLRRSQRVDDPELRRRIVDLAYRCQVLAEKLILDQLQECGIHPQKLRRSH